MIWKCPWEARHILILSPGCVTWAGYERKKKQLHRGWIGSNSENKKMFDSYLKYSGNISDTPIYHTVLNYHYVCFYFPYKTMSL